MADPNLLVASDSSSRIMDNGSLLLDNPNMPGVLRSNGDSCLGVNIFPPPPGLTIDPSKIVHVPNAASGIQSHPHLSTSYLTLPPPQALSGVITMEQQKKLMVRKTFPKTAFIAEFKIRKVSVPFSLGGWSRLQKMQKECNVSNIDEYAGMMTEREKYWLSGVQLLQINSMDPHKDDYYFTVKDYILSLVVASPGWDQR